MLIRKSIWLFAFLVMACSGGEQTEAILAEDGDFILPATSEMRPDVPSTTLIPEADVESLPLPSATAVYAKAETAQEKALGKQDSFDIRGTYADLFGITEIPSNSVRALAEFEQTDAVLIAWDEGLAAFMLDLIEATVLGADVWIVTWNLDETRLIERLLEVRGIDRQKVRFFEFPHESFWSRDYGPISVVDENGQVSFVDARYYRERRRDDVIPTLMARYFDVEVTRPNLATEGGNFMTNGDGICVVTEWLIEENPNLTISELQTIQQRYFGCRQTVVLERMAREGTGHIDMFAKFLSPNIILIGEYDELDQENAAIMDANVERLEQFAEENNWALQIIRIPMPYGAGGVYRSYTNSLIVNDVVVVPIYSADRRYEDEAIEVYQQNLPAGYTVVTVESEETIQLGGAVHCTTMGFAGLNANQPD